ncbi:hypothetical protein ACEPAF_3578 [Sanghuangporus sanghuang]
MLQYALRIGPRRYFCTSFPVSRAMNMSTTPVSSIDMTLRSDQQSLGVRDDSTRRLLEENNTDFSVDRGSARISLASPETRSTQRGPIQARYPSLSQVKAIGGDSSDERKSRLPRRSTRKDPKMSVLVSTTVDVNSLAPHEMKASSKDIQAGFIPERELQGVLKNVMPIPFKRTHHSLPHPATPQELELRLHQALTFKPLPSLSRLIKYHDSFPSLHSASSYGFLVQFAIRHTSYSKAFQLLRRMEEVGIKPNSYSKVLYVRLLVRVGRWNHAWSYVRQELASGSGKSALPLLLELLGFRELREFSRKTLPDISRPMRTAPEVGDDGYHASLVREWQKSILGIISNHLPGDAHPPVHFILTVVRHLLRNSRIKAARAVTMEWICHLPRVLSLPRKRHCLCLLHLHLAFSSKTLESYFSNRKFVDLFLQQRPDVRPNSTTLFLLLRSLTRANGKLTYHAVGLVRAFRKKWGPGLIDRRVRRRIAHIALREGRLDVAHTWMEAEDRTSRRRKLVTLQRVVVGEQVVKLPRKTRRMSFQKLMSGVDDENRKWRWLKRRFWRRNQSRLSRQTRSSMLVSVDEKHVAHGPIVDVENQASS